MAAVQPYLIGLNPKTIGVEEVQRHIGIPNLKAIGEAVLELLPAEATLIVFQSGGHLEIQNGHCQFCILGFLIN